MSECKSGKGNKLSFVDCQFTLCFIEATSCGVTKKNESKIQSPDMKCVRSIKGWTNFDRMKHDNRRDLQIF